MAEQTYSLPFDFTAHSVLTSSQYLGTFSSRKLNFAEINSACSGWAWVNITSRALIELCTTQPVRPPMQRNAVFELASLHAAPPRLQELFDRFKLNEPWNSAANLPLLAEMPDVFRSGNDGPYGNKHALPGTGQYQLPQRFVLATQ